MEEQINMQPQTHFQQVQPYPGRRFFARMLDITMYGMLWLCIQYFVFRWEPESGLFLNILINLITLGMMLFLEPLLLCTWGTTPGKWLFGLCVAQEDGGKLTYRSGLKRTFGLIRFGFGFGLPIYSIVRNFISYTVCMKGKPMRWDEGIQYRLLDRKTWRIFACFPMLRASH